MRTRKRGVASLAGIAAIALAATACGGSSGGTQGQTSSQSSGGGGTGFVKLATNASGTPVSGGILNALGVGDADFLDPNITYYTEGQALAHYFNRALYSYPAIPLQNLTPVPDLATAAPQVSADGLTYKVTIRTGAMWNTTPPRQVTAADAVRGIKAACNSAQPYGGLPDFENFIVGYKSYCANFAKVGQTASAIKKYLEGTQVSGISVDPSNPQTVVYKLVHPVSFFKQELALNAFNPRAIEMDAYVPGSAQEAQHTQLDTNGPYMVKSYNPGKSVDLVRNPNWKADTDPIRKAYVDEIKINETGDQNAIQQQLQTDSPSADLDWDTGPPSTVIPQLLAQNDPRLNIQSEIATNPYVLYNTQSPNNNGALKKVAVRQAISYAISRTNLIQSFGGPKLNPPLTHVIPSQLQGGSPDFDPYPYNPTKAKSMLQAAGMSHMTLKFLYRPASHSQSEMFQTLQADLAKVGITVKGVQATNADFYTKYLQVPSAAHRGVWDISGAGWGPDWYGNSSLSMFAPLFDGRALPPSSSNYGLFNDPKVNSLIDQAEAAKSDAESISLWQQADHQVMADAAFFPITDPNEATYHGSQVHNCVYFPQYQTCDYANVWLDKNKQGG